MRPWFCRRIRATYQAASYEIVEVLWHAKYQDIDFCTFFLSYPRHYQQERLAQNMREFLSRYLDTLPRAPYGVYFVTYHATVLRIPVSKVSVGCQPSSSCIRVTSMA